jgi:hypothetical protein
MLATGGATPLVAQPASPLSKPPLNTTDRVDCGVAGFEAVEAGPLPAGLDAVTVNVYVVPLVSPLTVPVVGAGEPVNVVGDCGVEPTYGVMVYVVAGPPVEGALQDNVAEA